MKFTAEQKEKIGIYLRRLIDSSGLEGKKHR